MNDRTNFSDTMNWHEYAPDEWYAMQQDMIARAHLERARAVRAGILWLVAAVRRPFARLGTRPEGTDVAPGATPHRA